MVHFFILYERERFLLTYGRNGNYHSSASGGTDVPTYGGKGL